MSIAILIKNLKKEYEIFKTPRERLKKALGLKYAVEKHVALSDINLTINKGDVLGILGKNGAGKSTLLEIISGVSKPTAGLMEINGRISAILELGAGFNPEFTGRENIEYHASLLNIKNEKIPDIVNAVENFADIGLFFDRPVKLYSSGMFVRVAFGLTISLDPDILIIDEALAVGDIRFQHKCIQRFETLKAANKTIILVTHSTEMVAALCNRAILVQDGKIKCDSDTSTVIDKYLASLFENKKNLDEELIQKPQSLECNDTELESKMKLQNRPGYINSHIEDGIGKVLIKDVFFEVRDRKDIGNIFRVNDHISIHIDVEFKNQVKSPIIGFSINTVSGFCICGTNTFMQGIELVSRNEGEFVHYSIDFKNKLNCGNYFLDIGIAEVDGTDGGTSLHILRSIYHFTIINGDKDSKKVNGVLNLTPKFEELKINECL